MKKVLCVVWDDVAKTSSDFYTFINDAVAVRWFKEYVRSIPVSSRSDFTLFKLASFDPEDMGIFPFSCEEVLFSGKDIKDEV